MCLCSINLDIYSSHHFKTGIFVIFDPENIGMDILFGQLLEILVEIKT